MKIEKAIDVVEKLGAAYTTFRNTPHPFCRDCADEDGICPRNGMPCDIGEATDALSTLLQTVRDYKEIDLSATEVRLPLEPDGQFHVILRKSGGAWWGGIKNLKHDSLLEAFSEVRGGR